MTDPTRRGDYARIPEESPEELGNTVDGSGAGDGSTTRGTGEKDTDEQDTDAAARPATAGDTGPAAGVAPGGGAGETAADRAEQARVYRTPEQPDRAVGGSDGTADGQ